MLSPTSSRLLSTAVLLLVVGFLVAGCNTMEGVGKDIGATGDAIEDTARDTKEKL